MSTVFDSLRFENAIVYTRGPRPDGTSVSSRRLSSLIMLFNHRSRSIVSAGRWELSSVSTLMYRLRNRTTWRGKCRRRAHTGIRHRDRRGVDVAKVVPDRGHNGHERRAGGAHDDGPEEGGTLAGGPAAVPQGGGPEDRRGRHCAYPGSAFINPWEAGGLERLTAGGLRDWV